MKDDRAALRYAQALLNLAEEKGFLERVQKELGEAVELVKRHREISHLLMNTTISLEEKEDFVEKILPQGFSSLTVNFLKLLVKKKRFQELSLVREKFYSLYEESRGMLNVRVESPVSLDSKLQEKLSRALAKKLNRTVRLDVTVSPEILGGLVLDFKGKRIDASLQTALLELKQKLLA